MTERNQTVDALRAIAALWVCLFHFTAGTGVGTYGYLGVTSFFVISGFIVPYSMMRAGYTLAAWPTFMFKRLVRLEPPYLVSIGLILALGTWDTFRGTPPAWTAMQIAGHVGYANAFLGLPWLNAVYWSLAVEFQFYVLMALALPMLVRAGTPVKRLAGVALASILPMFSPGNSNATILPFLPVFAAGTLTFLLATNRIGRTSYWPALAVLAAVVFKKHDTGVALATTATTVLIATVRIPRIRSDRLARRDLLFALSAAWTHRLSGQRHDQAIVRRWTGADHGDLWSSGSVARGSRRAPPIRGTAGPPTRSEAWIRRYAISVAAAHSGAKRAHALITGPTWRPPGSRAPAHPPRGRYRCRWTPHWGWCWRRG